MKQADAPKPVTIPDLAAWKRAGRRFSVLTAYDYPMARMFDQANVDILLVGDSLGTVVQGRETTLGVTLEQMLYHAEMVGRAAQRALVVADMPFGSYHASAAQAVENAARFLKETSCQAVKLEGGRTQAATIRAVVDAQIPVFGHVGLTPQSVRRLGGFKVQRDAAVILEDARAVVEAGATAIVLECIPPSVAAKVTAELSIPTIGIGAGPNCDAQVLVAHDMLGLFDAFSPRFVRRYAEVGESMREAAQRYVADVASGRFPTLDEAFGDGAPSPD
jgi:3-methyl-2-oxobutanoate hydroxymethyltransferase